MTDIYPMPNGTIWGADSFMSYIVGVEPLFFITILVVLWVVVFVAAKSYSSSRAWTFASFVCFILSTPITLLGWMKPTYMYLFLLLLAIGIIWIRIGDSYY